MTETYEKLAHAEKLPERIAAKRAAHEALQARLALLRACEEVILSVREVR